MSLTWKLRYRTHWRDVTMTTPHFAVLHNDRSCLKNMERRGGLCDNWQRPHCLLSRSYCQSFRWALDIERRLLGALLAVACWENDARRLDSSRTLSRHEDKNVYNLFTLPNAAKHWYSQKWEFDLPSGELRNYPKRSSWGNKYLRRKVGDFGLTWIMWDFPQWDEPYSLFAVPWAEMRPKTWKMKAFSRPLASLYASSTMIFAILHWNIVRIQAQIVVLGQV